MCLRVCELWSQHNLRQGKREQMERMGVVYLPPRFTEDTFVWVITILLFANGLDISLKYLLIKSIFVGYLWSDRWPMTFYLYHSHCIYTIYHPQNFYVIMCASVFWYVPLCGVWHHWWRFKNPPGETKFGAYAIYTHALVSAC